MDLQDDEGQDYPMTPEGLLRIPVVVLNPILKQTREHMRGNSTTSSSS